MWIKIGFEAMVNLDNVAEISWEKNDPVNDVYGIMAFFNRDGNEIDEVVFRTKKGYETAIEKLQRYATIDLSERVSDD